MSYFQCHRCKRGIPASLSDHRDVRVTRGGYFECVTDPERCAEIAKVHAMRISKTMEGLLRYLAGVDLGHRGDSSATSWNALNARGLIECVTDGQCSDSGKDVWLYRITDTGRAALAALDEVRAR